MTTSQQKLVGLLTAQLSEQISNPRILAYKPSSSGALTGRAESLGKVFDFIVNGNTVAVKPSAGRIDSALFSELYLERHDAKHYDAAYFDAVRKMPTCSSKSYACKGDKGVGCIPVTNNCRRTETQSIGKERLIKIRALTKELAADGGNTSKLSIAESSITSSRNALADKNRSERTPLKVEPKQKPLARPLKQKKPLNQKLVDKYVDHLKNVGGLPFSKQNSPEAKEAQKIHSSGLAKEKASPEAQQRWADKANEEDQISSKAQSKALKELKGETLWDKETGRVSKMKHAWELSRVELDAQFKDLEKKHKDNPEKLAELTKIYKKLRKASYTEK
jgi:hypothetical protein